MAEENASDLPPIDPATGVPYGARTKFAHAIAACGLTHAEAAEYLGQAVSTIEKKSVGARSMTAADGAALSALWHKIRQGHLRGLPRNSIAMAAALEILRGAKAVQPKTRKKKSTEGEGA